MGDREALAGQAIAASQGVDVRGSRVAQDVAILLVLHQDDDDVRFRRGR